MLLHAHALLFRSTLCLADVSQDDGQTNSTFALHVCAFCCALCMLHMLAILSPLFISCSLSQCYMCDGSVSIIGIFVSLPVHFTFVRSHSLHAMLAALSPHAFTYIGILCALRGCLHALLHALWMDIFVGMGGLVFLFSEALLLPGLQFVCCFCGRNTVL